MNLFDINGLEFLFIVVLAVVLIGPEKLPQYASQLARLVKRLRVLASDAKDKVSQELGPEVTDIDWAKLDPRQYDPRRIVREALADVEPILPTGPAKAGAKAASGSAAAAAAVKSQSGAMKPADQMPAPASPAEAPTAVVERASFDPEAT